jgi:hypothetical protein
MIFAICIGRTINIIRFIETIIQKYLIDDVKAWSILVVVFYRPYDDAKHLTSWQYFFLWPLYFHLFVNLFSLWKICILMISFKLKLSPIVPNHFGQLAKHNVTHYVTPSHIFHASRLRFFIHFLDVHMLNCTKVATMTKHINMCIYIWWYMSNAYLLYRL